MSSTNQDQEPTLFEILSLSTRSLDGQDPAAQTETVKKAYRRALLKHHPDKQAQTSSEDAAAASATSTQHFTVDQITEAYNVLSDGQQRRKYTRTLRQQSHIKSSSTASASSRTRRTSKSANVETVDLDDMSWSGKRRLYYRACQGCGKARGFTLREDDIDDEEEDVELVVECSGCEELLKVIVPALVDGTGSEGEWEGQRFGLSSQQSRTQQPQTHDQPPRRTNDNAEPEKRSRGWGLRLGLGLGLSLGGGANSSAGRSR